MSAEDDRPTGEAESTPTDAGASEQAPSSAAAPEDTTAASARTGLTTGMKRVIAIVGAVLAAAVVGIAILIATAGGTGGVSGGPADAGGPRRGPSPGATAVPGSEVQSPPPTAGQPTQPPPAPATPQPLVPTPFPSSGTADGGLVAGYPTDVMGPLDGSTVESSALTSDGQTMQVTLVARTSASAADVSNAYRAKWSGLGLVDAGPGSDPNALAFTNPSTALSLGFAAPGGTDQGTTYTIYGVFRAG